VILNLDCRTTEGSQAAFTVGVCPRGDGKGAFAWGKAVLSIVRLPRSDYRATRGDRLERSIRDSVRNALKLAAERGHRSIAFPLIGSGGGKPELVLEIMLDELAKVEFDGEVRIVRFF
jgi:O-acetyl-ADP-ribose deacetylase (regulator of RNase III)